jgi:hypothetical protein
MSKSIYQQSKEKRVQDDKDIDDIFKPDTQSKGVFNKFKEQMSNRAKEVAKNRQRQLNIR